MCQASWLVNLLINLNRKQFLKFDTSIYLQSGDVLLEINGQNAMTMTHKQAQEAIISAGDNVPLLVQRSGSLSAGPPAWRPKVEVVDGLPRTSLAANK